MTDPRAELSRWLRDGDLPELPENARGSLVEEAIRQGVAGRLHEAVVRASAKWPEPSLAVLRQAHRQQTARGVRQLDLAARLLERFERAGLRALPLKGVALADGALADGERPMADVDLLALDDFAAAARVAQADGLRLRERGDHAWVYVEEASGLWLELHHAPTSCPGLFPLDGLGLWRRRVRGRTLSALPSPEDLLVLLALHAAFQHGLTLSLAQWYDFRSLQREALDAALVGAIATSAGASAALYAALAAAAATVGAKPSADGAGAPAWLRAWLAARLRRPASVLIPSRPPLARMRLAVTGGRRAALVVRTLRPPLPAGVDPLSPACDHAA